MLDRSQVLDVALVLPVEDLLADSPRAVLSLVDLALLLATSAVVQTTLLEIVC